MKTLLVTSWVTFIPQNYDDFICGLASSEHVGGLLILDNRRGISKTVAALLACGAWRMGLGLLRNRYGQSLKRRHAAFAAHGKPVWTLPTINSPEALEIVRQGAFDLILNARTRFIYRQDILSAPPLGCINLHHGLLPDQRGTMCDLWALSEGKAAGFSLHKMNARIDSGAILETVQVSPGSDCNYPDYLARSARLEREAAQALLTRIACQPSLTGQPNTPTATMKYRKNPNRTEIRAMLRQGLKL